MRRGKRMFGVDSWDVCKGATRLYAQTRSSVVTPPRVCKEFVFKKPARKSVCRNSVSSEVLVPVPQTVSMDVDNTKDTKGSAGEKKDSGYRGGAPSNLGVNEGGVLVHNADEQPEAKQRSSRTVNLGQVPYSGLGSTMGTATAGAVDSTATGFGGSENTQANTDAAERGDKSE